MTSDSPRSSGWIASGLAPTYPVTRTHRSRFDTSVASVMLQSAAAYAPGMKRLGVAAAIGLGVASSALAATWPGPPRSAAPRLQQQGPPPAWVETLSRSKWMAFSSYCWSVSSGSVRKAVCADMIPPQSRNDLPTLTVRRGELLRILWVPKTSDSSGRRSRTASRSRRERIDCIANSTASSYPRRLGRRDLVKRTPRVPVSRRVVLRGEIVLVDQPAEQVAAPDAIEIDHVGRPPVGHLGVASGGRCPSERCGRCSL
jgi:hypothetical protein